MEEGVNHERMVIGQQTGGFNEKDGLPGGTPG